MLPRLVHIVGDLVDEWEHVLLERLVRALPQYHAAWDIMPSRMGYYAVRDPVPHGI